MEDSALKSHQNYELLIRIDEQMKNLTREVRDNNQSYAARMALIEEKKMDKTEVMELKGAADKLHEDHEKRIRVVEEGQTKVTTMIKTWGTVIGFIIGILQIIQIIVALK